MSETKALSKYYPKWITTSSGHRMVVPNHIHHGILIGKEVLEDGTVVEGSKPPTLEEVLAAGYKEPAASQIVAEEQEKFEKGYKPYGDTEEPAPPAPPAPPAEDVVEEKPEPIAEDVPAGDVPEKSNLDKPAEPTPAPKSKGKKTKPAKEW